MRNTGIQRQLRDAISSPSHSDKSEPPGFLGAAVSYGTEEKYESLVLLTSDFKANSAFQPEKK